MAVIRPELGTEGLAEDAHRIRLAGRIETLLYPPLCPNCGHRATETLPITKVFQFNHGDDGPWQYRIAHAAPLFCTDCIRRHQAEWQPLTRAERVKSVVVSELALPGFLTAAFALFLLGDSLREFIEEPGREWPMIAFAALLGFVSWLCFRAAASSNAHRRVAAVSSIQRAFDFGDDDSTVFATIQRTYAIRDEGSAEAFERLNAARSAALTSPEAKARENRRTWTFGLILGGLVLLYWWFE
ncbi:hypothetical protein [Sphingosinicella sp. BN140058]|uniref:hypothetical protein n=1 Tax=Sphingosinicella sp. BN140058 TaxID=1892855 RepID=UPI0010112FF0|nr:hypothetical protein [Sphingosinicella sp. BN140058]QAY77807.1 hypothetical protein ETR14_15745 [Sphingosinicella sp. BN140058]